MGPAPSTVRAAMMADVCHKLGFCDLDPDDITDAMSRDEIVRMIFVADGLSGDSWRWERSWREGVEQIVDDWLFDPRGRGARSRLPR